MIDSCDALAVGAKKSAAMVGLSVSTWWRHDALGLIPRGHRIGKRKVWRLSDLQAWASAGFPDREAFERLKK